MGQFTMLQADSRNVYRMHTPLKIILQDGHMRGFKPQQTLREASNAGFARCVVEPLLIKEWDRLDKELADFEATNCTTQPPVTDLIKLVPYTCIDELQQF